MSRKQQVGDWLITLFKWTNELYRVAVNCLFKNWLIYFLMCFKILVVVLSVLHLLINFNRTNFIRLRSHNFRKRGYKVFASKFISTVILRQKNINLYNNKVVQGAFLSMCHNSRWCVSVCGIIALKPMDRFRCIFFVGQFPSGVRKSALFHNDVGHFQRIITR